MYIKQQKKTIEGKAFMRKIKLIEIVVPELVGCIKHGTEHFADFRCKCDMGVEQSCNYCPFCGAQLNWRGIRKISEEF